MIKNYFIKLLFIVLIALPYKANALEARITNLNDLSGSWTGESGAINLEDDICVYSDSGNYTVTASGSGSNNNFRVEDGAEVMSYTVRWNDVAGTTSGQVKLTKNSESPTQTTTETVSSDCGGGSSLTARIQIRFSNTQLRKNLPGVYIGTLTLLITPT